MTLAIPSEAERQAPPPRFERRSIPLAAITLSMTEAQVQRRQSFVSSELDELAESIKQHGLVNPILVRPDPKWSEGEGQPFELVAGERRFLAAQRAGLEEIDATVRDLTDEQVLEIQLIENLQRSDLHPLHEAEGYEQLMHVHGHTADELADKVGKSRRYVYARIQLLKLCKEARQAFYDGKLNASTALLVARIPASMQAEAIQDIAGDDLREPLSARNAAEFIQRHYMLNLADAPFPTIIENLVKGTPACHRCPKNTNAQPELFEDVKASSAGVCTDLACFRNKQIAHIADTVAKAKKNGQKVIEGEAAKKIFPYGTHYAQGGYLILEHVKDRLKKDAPITLVRVRDTFNDGPEQLIEVVETKYVDAPKAPAPKKKSPTQTKQDVERERSDKLRATLFRMVFDKTKVSLRDAVVTFVADYLTYAMSGDLDAVLDALGFEDWNLDDHEKELAKLTPEKLAKFLAVLPLADDLSWGDADKIEAAAKALKINIAAVEKELFPPAQKATAKAAKKKAARKPK